MEISNEEVESREAMCGHIHQMVARQKKKQNPPDLTELYNKWGESYDKHFRDYFCGAIYCAESLTRHLAGQNDIRILDVGAGTGAVGVELRKRGFTNIDAVEPSVGMLEKAKEKNVYNKIYTEYFTEKVDYLETDTYDAVVSSGAFGPGAMYNSYLPEFVRITKPGGLVVLSMRIVDGKPNADPVPLEKAGKWTLLEEDKLQEFFYEDEQGQTYILRITK